MQAADRVVERRQTPGSRVPFEGLVELDPGRQQAPIFADAVNLSLGGLTMHGRDLPVLGEQLTCRFAADTQDPLEVPAEVVWTSAASGRCGLKFLQLDQRSERSLRSLVLGAYVPPPIADPPSVESGCRRILFQGVSEPVSVKVLHEDLGGLTIEQALPFLSLDTEIITEEGKAGRIETVELVVDGDVPKLVVDLAYQHPMQLPDGTLRDEGLEEALWPEPSDPTLKGNHTLPGVGFVGVSETDEASGPGTVPLESQAPAAELRFDQTAPFDLQAVDEQAIETLDPDPHATLPGQPVQELAPNQAKNAETDAVEASTSVEEESPRGQGQEAVDALMELPMGLWGGVRKLGRYLPSGKTVRTHLGHQLAQGGRATGQAVGWAKGVVARARTTSDDTPKLREKKRKQRVTRRSGARSLTLSPKASAETAAPRVRWGRYVVAAVLLGLGLWLVGRAIPTTNPAPQTGNEVNSGDTRLPEVVVATPPAPEGVPGDSPYAATPAPAPAEVPAAESVPPAESTLFGSETVDGGETFVLRMSQPIRAIEGSELDDGFKVLVPGSLSLGRAGPIARSHDKVDRSMVLNRGNRAELTVRFAAGETPAYRVRARGASLEITIEK